MKIGLQQLNVDPTATILVTPMGTITSRYKVGDRRPFLDAQLLQPDGDPQDLTGATVLFRARDKQTRLTVVNDQAATVLTPPEGRVRYEWQAGETSTAAELEAWFLVDFPDGRRATYPNRGAHAVVIEP